MLTSKMTSRGQITIPLEYRKKLNINEGDKLEFVLMDGVMMILPIYKKLSDLKGSLAKLDKNISVEEMEATLMNI